MYILSGSYSAFCSILSTCLLWLCALPGMSLAAASQDKEMEKAMLGHLRNLATASSKILLAAKTLGADPSAPNAFNQLSAAARWVLCQPPWQHLYYAILIMAIHTYVDVRTR